MNVLDLIRARILKKEHLNDAQFLMAKAYRGVPYVDAHHDLPATEEGPVRETTRPTPSRAVSDSVDTGSSAEKHMNVLDMIRAKTLKKEHLNDAQFLMAKAYRGVPYVDAHHDHPGTEDTTRHLTYRGQSYEH